MKKQVLPPQASSLTESMRDIGYRLETAIADIIDNSIAAAASKVEICFNFNSGNPTLGILDDGCGMTRSELIDAMRHGSVHPRSERTDGDLGRFGLGLKTASFSQCRQFAVVSRRNGETSGAVWDLDTISEENEWILGILEENEIQESPYVNKLKSVGTLVLWNKLDRLSTVKEKTGQKVFYEKIEAVEKHLSLVFHRFLAGEVIGRKLNISINGHQVEPFDPFCLKNKATQHLRKETIRIDGHRILIQPYILPHHSKLSRAEHDFYRHRSEFVNNQGVYIYRNNRLMTWGNWFRLIPKGEATKLARVRIDFPNALDEYWTIDIKKSKADPPHQVRDKLRQIIGRIEGQSVKIHRNTGSRISDKTKDHLWIRYARHGGIDYELNKEHPVIRAFVDSIKPEKQKMLLGLLDIIGKSIPVEIIYSDYSSSPKSFEENDDIDRDKIRASLSILFDILSEQGGLSETDFRKTVNDIRLFSKYTEEIEEVIREKFHD